MNFKPFRKPSQNLAQLPPEIARAQCRVDRGQERLVLRSANGRQRAHFLASVLEPVRFYRHLSVFVSGALIERYLSIPDDLKKPLLRDPVIVSLKAKSVEPVGRNELQVKG